MIPIVSVIGRSGSGKTTLLEKVIKRLTDKGYRVGTIKHDAHGFDIDYEGKDSWRHKKAGAKTVVLSSSKKIAVIKDVTREWLPERLVSLFLDNLDIVITEGYKKAPFPKIETVRKACSLKPISINDRNLIAIASDIKSRGKVPHFDINDSEGIADFIEEQFLKVPTGKRATLIVDGKVITLKPFIEALLLESISGTVRSLKGCTNPKYIDIRIKV
ncbi:MAG: molybdopterin-guanine dinucleotide biosynthesis protein B [Thermodesulfobacteriota bacterium]